MADESRAFWDFDESATFWHKDGAYQYCIFQASAEKYYVQRTFISRIYTVESILHDDDEWYDPIFQITGAARKLMSLECARAAIEQDAKLLGVFDNEISRVKAL